MNWLSFSPTLLLGVLVLLTLAFLFIPALRRWGAWRLPVFREASLAQASGTVAITLGRGVSLPDALALAEALAPRTPAAGEWRRWRAALSEGRGGVEEFAATQRTFPKVFGWLLAGSGESLAEGFATAASVFAARARARSEILVQTVTPVLLLIVGIALTGQVFVMVKALAVFMDSLGGS